MTAFPYAIQHRFRGGAAGFHAARLQRKFNTSAMGAKPTSDGFRQVFRSEELPYWRLSGQSRNWQIHKQLLLHVVWARPRRRRQSFSLWMTHCALVSSSAGLEI